MNVLIMDDQLRSQMQIYLALRRKHDVQVAFDEKDALDILNKRPTDLMLLDLDYPSESSNNTNQHLALRVRKNYPGVRLIGIHNRDASRLSENARLLGFHDLISRPIKNKQLAQILNY